MPSLLEHAVIELSDGRYCQGWPSRSWTTLLRRGRPCSIAAEGVWEVAKEPVSVADGRLPRDRKGQYRKALSLLRGPQVRIGVRCRRLDFSIGPGSEFDAEPCLRRPAIRRCACARADRGDRKRFCPHPRYRAVARRIPPRALRLPQRLGVGRVARRQLHRALPKLRDRVSEPPLDKLMTLQGVYEKWLGTLPPTLGERHGGRASGNG